MKTLKEQGVPFGARCVFRLQWVLFVGVALLLLLSLPLAILWACFHASGVTFLTGANGVLESRIERIELHRERLVRLYSQDTA